MLIAPCTASTLGKMANGVADNMLITTYLSMKAPVFIAPAMDLDMYQHPTTQANIQKLQSFGNLMIEPQSGFLASGLEGKGRMEEPEQIVRYLDYYFEEKDLKGKKIMITAGPTYEKIDPVRFIGNYSSGKMGIALAEQCARRGAEVSLIAGPISSSLLSHISSLISVIKVENCEEMYQAATQTFATSDAAILCAAVADFRPDTIAGEKIKREKDDLVIRLKPTHDIAAELGSMKKPHQRMVGFALETDNELQNAQSKLERKNLDFIVLNTLRNQGTCFQSDDNQISIISRNGQQDYPRKPKSEVAKDIIDQLVTLL